MRPATSIAHLSARLRVLPRYPRPPPCLHAIDEIDQLLAERFPLFYGYGLGHDLAAGLPVARDRSLLVIEFVRVVGLDHA